MKPVRWKRPHPLGTRRSDQRTNAEVQQGTRPRRPASSVSGQGAARSAPQPRAPRDVAAETPLHRAGKGTPLLLLHGAGVTWRTWKPILSLIEPHHDVIAPTLIGHNGGPALAEDVPVSMDVLVDGVISELDRLGCDQVHVAGNSLGGWIALELARRNRALSVIAFSPGGAWRSKVRYAAITVAMDASLALIDAFGDRVEQLAVSPRGRRLLGRVACKYPERLDPTEFLADIRALRATPALKNLMRALGATPLGPLEAPNCPIRIVWARRDRVVPFRHFGEPLLERLPTAELVILDGVGHVPMIDDPRSVADLILEVTSAVDRGKK
jgi:pimeloyl-ACP methyl ester carboxylesterase